MAVGGSVGAYRGGAVGWSVVAAKLCLVVDLASQFASKRAIAHRSARDFVRELLLVFAAGHAGASSVGDDRNSGDVVYWVRAREHSVPHVWPRVGQGRGV